jgi:hypothetical protein
MTEYLDDAMSLTRRTLTAVAFAICASRGFAATPSKHDVLEAISVMEKSVSGPGVADAAKTIVIYAQLSDDVTVDLGPEQLPWLSEKWDLEKETERTCQSMLMAAFVAGNIKSQIKNDKAEDDTYSGWVFAIETYHRLSERDHFRSASIEELSKMQSEGKLLQHARDLQSSEEEQEKADTPEKPMASRGTRDGVRKPA